MTGDQSRTLRVGDRVLLGRHENDNTISLVKMRG
jgi:hypothetical protein